MPRFTLMIVDRCSIINSKITHYNTPTVSLERAFIEALTEYWEFTMTKKQVSEYLEKEVEVKQKDTAIGFDEEETSYLFFES